MALSRRAFLAVAGLGVAACACIPTSAVAAEGTPITFPNGGTATLHADGSITGTCALTDCTVEPRDGGTGYEWVYSMAHMPDGSTVKVLCYEQYIGAENNMRYAGPADGTCEFTATKKADGGYFLLVHSDTLPRCWAALGMGWNDLYPDWPTQRTYNDGGWNPPMQGKGRLTKSASRKAWA